MNTSIMKAERNKYLQILQKYIAIVPIFIQATINGYVIRKFTGRKSSSKCLPILMVELFKLMISSYMKTKQPVDYNLDIFTMGIITFCKSILMWNFVYRLHPMYFSVCYQSRIIFLCVISYIVMKKRFFIYQYWGQGLIFIGIILPEILKNHIKSKSQDVEVITCLAIITAGFLNSFGSVFFEVKIKKKVQNFWDYTFQYSVFAVIITFIGCVVEFYTKEIDIISNFESLFFWLAIILNSLGSMVASYLALILCPLTRTFLMILSSAMSTTVISLLLQNKIQPINIFSLIIVYTGTMIYEIGNTKTVNNKKNNHDIV
ncbi:hypothetical protein CWI36_0548p0010 [Hamiltosporidium magnivora]|uniref:Nucleotide-sugar transporter n=1 Tax=Hamiltosporidium magnivora TaxID=148818 RepID=A0A4Q9LEN5_9MICR|nr:hypothetical protein CWI36_0548p0010 [Hamiltosporidium magnivora]